MIHIAFIGNPNSGKTSLFNNLTGLRQHVGNWPGKTVEKKEGIFTYKGKKIKVIDLPGIYSLSAYSLEEQIARDYIIKQKPEIIVNIVDASNLERNLYLTTQLIELNQKIIVALNLNKYAKKKGQEIDIKIMSDILGVPVVEIEAINDMGKLELVEMILSASKTKIKKKNIYEKSREFKATSDELDCVDTRYRFIEFLLKKCLVKRKNRAYKSDKIDSILTHKYLGLPAFLFIMYLIFQLTFTIGQPLVDIIDAGIGYIGAKSALLSNYMGFPDWLSSLLSDGIIAGVGSVLVFVPNIVLLFFSISVLEDSGYLSRAAYVMDRFMTRIGLHGKAFIPLLLGFGCNVPAIMATRTLKEPKDRLLTILLIPFMSCSARLTVYILFISAFFTQYRGLVLLVLYTLGILVAIISGFLLRKTMLKGSTSYLLIELPPYRVPRLRNVLISMWQKTKAFLRTAGTIIISAVIVIWFFANLPLGVKYASEQSLIGMMGNALKPIFMPLGFGGWKPVVALIFGFVAKEVVVSTFGTLYGFEGDKLVNVLSSEFTPLSAFSFMVFTLLYVPCLATVSVIKKETNSWKWTLFSLIFSSVVAWIVTLIVYQGGLFIGLR